MAYTKQRYVSNLNALNYWSDSLKTQNSLNYTNVLKTTQDMSWQKQLQVINNFDWKTTLNTPQNSMGFTGVAYKWTPDSSINPMQSVTLYDKDNDSQINSIVDAAAMANNHNVQHSHILNNVLDWWNTLFRDDVEKEFYYKYKAATGKIPNLRWTMTGPTSEYKALQAYRKLKENKDNITFADTVNYGFLTKEQLNHYKNNPDYIVPENAKTIYEITDKWGYPILSGITFKKDNNGNINIVGDKQQGFGGRYNDGSYEFNTLGDMLVGHEITKKWNNIGNGFKNFINDSAQVLWDSSYGPQFNPNLTPEMAGYVALNNTIVNLSETMDLINFVKPMIQTIADQYDDYIQQGNKRDLSTFLKILYTKDQSLIFERRRNLARYYGVDINEYGELSESYKGGRHQIDYNNVLDKLLGIDFEVNVLSDVGKVINTIGTVVNEVVNIPNNIQGTPRNDFGLDWGKWNFEINLGDLVMEMIDPSSVANALSVSTNAAKGASFIKHNSRDLAEEIVDGFYKGVDYKTLPYADRLQLYDYVESYLKNHADDFGTAYARDFERAIQAQHKAGKYFQGVDITSANATNREIQNMFFKLNSDLGGTINPKLTQLEYSALNKAISNGIVRNNANTILTSLTGGLSDFAYITSHGALKAVFLPVEVPATVLGKGLKNLATKLGIPDKFNKVADSLVNTVKTEFRKELESTKQAYKEIVQLNNSKTKINNIAISRKLEQIIKDNLISYDFVDKGFLELGATPDQIISIQTRVLAEEVVPEIVDVLKTTDNPTQIIDQILPVLNQFSSKNITDLTDFIQVLKDMQKQLIKEYNFTNYGTAALTSRMQSKYAFTGMENLIKVFEDLDQLIDALTVKDTAKFLDVDSTKLKWADEVIATSDWALEAGITGATQKQTRFMWALSEAQNQVIQNAPYDITATKKEYTQVVKDLLGFQNYNVGKLGTYVYQIRDALKDKPKFEKLSTDLKIRTDSLSYFAKQLAENPATNLSGTVEKYALYIPNNDTFKILGISKEYYMERYIQPLMAQLTDIDELGYYKINPHNTEVLENLSKDAPVQLYYEIKYTTANAMENIAEIQKLLQQIQKLNLNIVKPDYTKFINTKALSEEIIKAIGIQAKVLHFSDQQLQDLWKLVAPEVPISLRMDIGHYFLNSNRPTQEFDTGLKITNYNQERIVKAYLSMVADNTNSATALDYIKNIYKATINDKGKLVIHYDYVSDIQQGLNEMSEYFLKYNKNSYDIMQAGNIRFAKLEEYANRRYLYDHNSGIKLFEEHPLAHNLIMNINNIDSPMFKTIYEGLGITKDSDMYHILQELYFILQGKQNMINLEQMIRTSKHLDTETQKAVLTALYYTDTQDYYDIALNPRNTSSGSSLDAWKQAVLQDITDYLGFTNLDYEKDNLYSLLKKYNIPIDKQKVTIINKEEEIQVPTSSGLSDIEQVGNKLVELIHTIKSQDKNYKKENIIVLAMNNTQKIGGYPFEFNISVLGEDGKGHTLATSKINYYSFKNALDALPLTTQLASKYYYKDKDEFFDTYLWHSFYTDFSNPDLPEKTIDKVLLELYEVLTTLSLSAEKSNVEKIKIYGFGNKQDIINLRSAINRFGLPAEFDNVLDRLEFVDFLNEEYRPSQNSSFKTLSTEATKEIDNILNYYFNNAKANQKIANNLQRRVKMADGLNTEAMQRLSPYIESYMAKAALIYADTSAGKLAINALANIEHFFDIDTSMSNEVKSLIYSGLNQLLTDFANDTRNIDKTNNYFKHHFTDHNFISEPEFLRMVSEQTNIPFDTVLNSTTQVYNAVVNATLTFGEKNFKTDLLGVLDVSKLNNINRSSAVAIIEIAEAINNEASRIKNARPLNSLLQKHMSKFIGVMKSESTAQASILKSDLYMYLKEYHANPKETWATIVQIKNSLEYRMSVTPKDTEEYEAYNALYTKYKELLDKYSDIKNLLEDSTELYEPLINWDGTTNLDKFKYNAYIDLPYQLKVQKAMEDVTKSEYVLSDMLKHLERAREMNFSKAIEDSFEYVKTPLTELHNYLVKLKKSKPEEVKRKMDVSKTLKEALDVMATVRRLQMPDEVLLKYLIANTPDRFFLVNIPESIQEGIVADYAEVYLNFLKRKEDLQKIGINLTEHPDEGVLEISLDYDMYSSLIKQNKDYNTQGVIKYKFNNEKVAPIIFDDLTQEELNILYTITQDKQTVDELLQLKRNFEEIEPTLVGNVGNLYSELFWEQFKNTEFAQSLKAIKWIQNRPSWDKGTLYNEWNLGTSQTINKIQPTSPNMINVLIGLGNRLSKSHEDYAEVLDMFLNNSSGFSFKGNILKGMSNEEINEMLKNNPDMRILLPVQDKLFNSKKASGGVRLTTINEVNKTTRKQLEDGGGLIVPFDIYNFALHHVNNFRYGNWLTSLQAKVVSRWKVLQIIFPGTQIRNAIDTPLKTFGAVEDFNMFLTNEAWAIVNIKNYEQIMMDIKQAYGHIDDRLIDLYFQGRIKGTPIMSRQAFNILDSYYRVVGETIDDDVSFLQKILAPTSYTEKINRIALYKSFMDQGYTTSEAADHFSNLIHFDYTTKNRTEAYAKFIFPYWTYLTSQLRWFLEHFINQPELVRFFIKAYENHWEQDDRFNNENAFGLKDNFPNNSVLYTKFNGLLLDKDSKLTFKGNPSMWDSLNLFANPEQEIASKLAVPVQIVYNTIMEAVATSATKDNANLSILQQYIKNAYATYDTKTKHSNTGIAWVDSLYNWMQDNRSTKAGGGNYSVQSMSKGKYNLISSLAQLVPFLGSALTKFESGVKNFQRSGKWEDLMLPSLFGAIQDKITYEHKDYYYPTKSYVRTTNTKPRKAYTRKTYIRRPYARRSYAKKTYPRKVIATNPRPNQTVYYKPGMYNNLKVYYNNFNTKYYNTLKTSKVPAGNRTYTRLMSNALYPNRMHYIRNHYTKLQSIPQYLHSYNGLTRTGKSKLLSWMNMSTRYKVKTTLKRQARARSLYSKV